MTGLLVKFHPAAYPISTAITLVAIRNTGLLVNTESLAAQGELQPPSSEEHQRLENSIFARSTSPPIIHDRTGLLVAWPGL